MYRIVSGVTSDVSVPSTYLVSKFVATKISHAVPGAVIAVHWLHVSCCQLSEKIFNTCASSCRIKFTLTYSLVPSSLHSLTLRKWLLSNRWVNARKTWLHCLCTGVTSDVLEIYFVNFFVQIWQGLVYRQGLVSRLKLLLAWWIFLNILNESCSDMSEYAYPFVVENIFPYFSSILGEILCWIVGKV